MDCRDRVKCLRRRWGQPVSRAADKLALVQVPRSHDPVFVDESTAEESKYPKVEILQWIYLRMMFAAFPPHRRFIVKK